MSLETWKKEFYPVSADSDMTEREAIEHSIQKWTGLLKKNLKKHEVTKVTMTFIKSEDSYYFSITSDSCALCMNFLDSDLDENCERCPLYKTLGHSCSKNQEKYPYEIWMETGDPKPMIRALRKTLKAYDAGKLK